AGLLDVPEVAVEHLAVREGLAAEAVKGLVAHERHRDGAQPDQQHDRETDRAGDETGAAEAGRFGSGCRRRRGGFGARGRCGHSEISAVSPAVSRSWAKSWVAAGLAKKCCVPACRSRKQRWSGPSRSAVVPASRYAWRAISAPSRVTCTV